MKRFFKLFFIFMFLLSVSTQSFAAHLCCKNGSGGAKIEAKKSESNKMPCHNMAKNETSKTDLTKDQSSKSHKTCQCDMGNCAAKIYIKSPLTHNIKIEQISFSNLKMPIISFQSDSSEQPPKRLA